MIELPELIEEISPSTLLILEADDGLAAAEANLAGALRQAREGKDVDISYARTGTGRKMCQSIARFAKGNG
jgi:hypothetical protein